MTADYCIIKAFILSTPVDCKSGKWEEEKKVDRLERWYTILEQYYSNDFVF